MRRPDRPWFNPRRFGWGWGAPATCQGWATLALFMGGLVGAQALITPTSGAVLYLVVVVALVAALVAVCWSSSGPPRWRWGEDD